MCCTFENCDLQMFGKAAQARAPSDIPESYAKLQCILTNMCTHAWNDCEFQMHEHLFSNPKRKPGAQCPAAWHPNFRMCCTCSERLRTRNKRKPIQQPQTRTLSLRLCCRASHDRMCCTCLERMQHGIAKQHKHQPRSENPQA